MHRKKVYFFHQALNQVYSQRAQRFIDRRMGLESKPTTVQARKTKTKTPFISRIVKIDQQWSTCAYKLQHCNSFIDFMVRYYHYKRNAIDRGPVLPIRQLPSSNILSFNPKVTAFFLVSQLIYLWKKSDAFGRSIATYQSKESTVLWLSLIFATIIFDIIERRNHSL